GKGKFPPLFPFSPFFLRVLRVLRGFIYLREDKEIKLLPSSGESDYRTKVIRQAMELSSQLQETLVLSDAEINNLPVLARPIARSLFKSKAGQSLQDWIITATNLTEQLKKIEAADVTAKIALQTSYPSLRGLLAKLIEFCRAVPGETTRFTKDTHVLRDVMKTAAQREALIRSLISVLDTVMYP
ncbi:MAG: hypothetical protein L0Y56_03995, partial [Nitrospira sp.]|nr:hypothetical protein [Nitrospira sp.]